MRHSTYTKVYLTQHPAPETSKIQGLAYIICGENSASLEWFFLFHLFPFLLCSFLCSELSFSLFPHFSYTYLLFFLDQICVTLLYWHYILLEGYCGIELQKFLEIKESNFLSVRGNLYFLLINEMASIIFSDIVSPCLVLLLGLWLKVSSNSIYLPPPKSHPPFLWAFNFKICTLIQLSLPCTWRAIRHWTSACCSLYHCSYSCNNSQLTVHWDLLCVSSQIH